MKKNINIRDMFFTKQFVLFLFVGGINTVNGLIFPAIFSLIMNTNLAYILSYVPSLSISYVLNSFITFKDKKLTLEKYIKFVISYIPNFIIQNISFVVIYNILMLHKFIAILFASVIGIPVTFIILKLFAFKKESNLCQENHE